MCGSERRWCNAYCINLTTAGWRQRPQVQNVEAERFRRICYNFMFPYTRFLLMRATPLPYLRRNLWTLLIIVTICSLSATATEEGESSHCSILQPGLFPRLSLTMLPRGTQRANTGIAQSVQWLDYGLKNTDMLIQSPRDKKFSHLQSIQTDYNTHSQLFIT